MLSSDGVQSLDTDTFNIDPLGPGYAIIAYDASDSFAPTWNATISGGTPANSGSEPSGSPLITQYVDRPFFNLSDAILRDMAARVKEFGTPYVVLNNFDSFDASREQLLVGGLELGLASQFATAGVSSKFDMTIYRADGAHPLQLLPENRPLLGSVISVGLQLSTGDSLPLSSAAPSAIAAVDRVENLVPPGGEVSVSVPVSIARPADGAAWLVIAPTTPANTIRPIRGSDSQIDIGHVIDELINSGGGFVEHGMPGGPDASGAESVLLTDSGITPQADGRFNAPVAGNSTKLAGGETFDEGGMIAVQGIVGQIAAESLTPSAIREAIATDAPAEITGELARVTVMELIEGQADPTAPESAADHTYLVAVDDANFTLERIALAGNRGSSAAFAAVRVMADQAGLAASLVTPASPIQLAAVVSAASDAFASAAMSAPLSTVSAATGFGDDARSEAFSQWDDVANLRADDDRSGHSSYGLVLSALAVERVVASRRKKKLNAAAAPPLPVR